MNADIITPDGDLKREVWSFSLSMSYSMPCIYFDAYSFQTRENTRCRRWQRETHWQRLYNRDNNIPRPQIPSEVEKQARQILTDKIRNLPIEEGK